MNMCQNCHCLLDKACFCFMKNDNLPKNKQQYNVLHRITLNVIYQTLKKYKKST